MPSNCSQCKGDRRNLGEASHPTRKNVFVLERFIRTRVLYKEGQHWSELHGNLFR